MEKREIKIVQFPHSYREHDVSRCYHEGTNGHIMEWREMRDAHARKFMKAKGQIVVNGKLSAPTDLLFWGEWEADSRFKKLPQDGKGCGPKWLHEPLLDRGKPNRVPEGNIDCDCEGRGTCMGKSHPDVKNVGEPYSLQNTDPLVFGDCFLYSLCRQFKRKRKSKTEYEQRQMAKLAPGSIVLFGSRLPETEGCFCFLLDAVFVVGDCRQFLTGNASKDLKGFVPDDYFDIMHFENCSEINVSLTCYKGVTFEQSLDPQYQINGMYSFVPCRPYNGDTGFERPRLYAKHFVDIGEELVITENLCRTVKGTIVTEERARRFWECVCKIISDQGFEKGVNLRYETK